MNELLSNPSNGEANVLLSARDIDKAFTLHAQGATVLDVLAGIGIELRRGECVALTGPSGSGKSTFLRCLYGNYRPQHGSVHVRYGNGFVDLTTLESHELLRLRRTTLGYVSQFLRVVPRVPALSVVAEPLLELGLDPAEAAARAAVLMRRLALPERLWHLSPTTFSGGERQRVNVARALIVDLPILLLDEPTSALDGGNRDAVVGLLRERLAGGCGMIGIFHDAEVRERLATRTLVLDVRR